MYPRRKVIVSTRWRRKIKHSKRTSFFRKRRANSPRIFPTKRVTSIRRRHPLKFRIHEIYDQARVREPKPLMDILEEKNEVIVVAEFVGFKKENLKTQVKNQRLTLSADTLDRKYYKSLNLPTRVIPNTLRVRCKNGVLEIRLRKAIEEKTLESAG